MKGPEFNEEELDRKLRAFFREEAAKAQPSDEWWDAALARVREQGPPRRRWRLPPFLPNLVPLPPLPVTAAAGLALMVGLSVLAALVLGPAMGREEGLEREWSGIGVADQVPATPSPAPPGPAAEPRPASPFTLFGLQSERRAAQVFFVEGVVRDFAASDGLDDSESTAFTIRLSGAAPACLARDPAETLDESEFALDGTVRQVIDDVDAPRVLLEVRRWYKGGDSRFVLVQAETAGPTGLAEPGERWLLAGHRGDDGGPRSDACGLVEGYSEEAAAEWEAVLAP